MSTTQVVSATTAANFATTSTGGVVDTGDKFATGVNEVSMMQVENLPPVSTTCPMANNGNNMRLADTLK